MANTYDVGDQVQIYGTWTNAAGTAIDPTTVYCAYTSPAGTTTTLKYGTDAALHKSGTGAYYVDVNVGSAGEWYYVFYSSGTGRAAGEDMFVVQTANVTRTYS